MLRTIILACTILTAAGCSDGATAQSPEPTPPDGIEWVALRDINAYYFDPDDPTNRPPLATHAPEGMIRAVDVSRDGKPDWLIDYQVGELSSMCGTGGCLQRLYVSDGDHYVRAVDNQALELTVQQGVVSVWVHHLYCADDNPDCRYSFEWDPQAMKLVQRSTTSAAPMGPDVWAPVRTEEEPGEE